MWKTKNLFSVQLMYFFFILKLKSKLTLLNVYEIKNKRCFQMKNSSHPICNSSQAFKVDRKVILFLFYRQENRALSNISQCLVAILAQSSFCCTILYIYEQTILFEIIIYLLNTTSFSYPRNL